MTRTRSQNVTNNSVKTETTTKKMVKPTSQTAVVNAGTSTKGLSGDGGSYPAVNAGDITGTNVDLRFVVTTLCDRIANLEKCIMEQFRGITALTKRRVRVDVGVQVDITEQDRSPRATYADAVKSPTRTGIESDKFVDTTVKQIYSCCRFQYFCWENVAKGQKKQKQR